MPRTASSLTNILDPSPWEHLSLGVLVVDRQGRVVYANQAASPLLGPRAEGEDAPPLAEGLPELWPEAQAVFDQGAPRLGARLWRGGRQYLVSHLPVLEQGRVAGVVVHLADLAPDPPLGPSHSQPFQEAEAQLEAIMDASFDGLWISDHQGVVRRVNQAALKMVGLPRDRVEGRQVADLLREGNFQESVTLEVLRRKTAVTILQNLRSGKKVLATGVPIFDQAGEVAFVVINDRDITLLDSLRQEIEQSQAQLAHYRSALSQKQMLDLVEGHFFCQSRAMRDIYRQVTRVAPTNSMVLISGESGVGKGLLAKLIHQESARAQGPFIRVDCAAIPSSLFESEMFGYIKGAFTGADAKGKLGLVELARGGTLFLDEIAEVAPEAQAKLLRFLDERSFVPVGGSVEKQLDARVIAATNRDLAAEVEAKRFRDDLFYRCNVVPLTVPPLRERPLDIVELTRFFLRRLGQENRIHKEISPAAQASLVKYPFPGNVRELENLVERMLIMSTGPEILPEDLPPEIGARAGGGLGVDFSSGLDLRQRLREWEVTIIRETLKRLGSQRAAARHLGISQSALARKLQAANR